MSHEFRVDDTKSTKVWVELTGAYPGTPGEVWVRAVAKWDGCIHFYCIHNAPEGFNAPKPDETDYLHICDIDEMIADLQEIKRQAQAYFPDQEAWKPK